MSANTIITNERRRCGNGIHVSPEWLKMYLHTTALSWMIWAARTNWHCMGSCTVNCSDTESLYFSAMYNVSIPISTFDTAHDGRWRPCSLTFDRNIHFVRDWAIWLCNYTISNVASTPTCRSGPRHLLAIPIVVVIVSVVVATRLCFTRSLVELVTDGWKSCSYRPVFPAGTRLWLTSIRCWHQLQQLRRWATK